MSIHETLEYKDIDGNVYSGELYTPSSKYSGTRPGVLIFPAFRGVTQLEMERAKEIAEECGYVALVADVYGKGIRFTDIPTAVTVIRPLTSDRNGKFKSRLECSLNALKAVPSVDKTKLAAFGFCFGGLCSLDVARHRFDGIRAVISFHGTLSPIEGNSLDFLDGISIQVHHGDLDEHVTKASVDAFHEEMRARNADFVFVSHGKAMHSFTDPNSANIAPSGVGYNEKADKRSWKSALDLFEKVFV
uniref:DLH domain-containing protein n=1 Tax=Caenorhabditis tropicalis TaxID=1561998 RepID=A0A1I7T031_9PELO